MTGEKPEVKTSGFRAGQLRDALMGTPKERLETERTLLLRMTPGQRPTVTFTGFWTGKFIRGALDSISKAYRMCKHRPSRPFVKPTVDAKPTGVEKKEE